MNPLLTALVSLGLLSETEAQRLSAQLDPVQARAYAETQLTTAFTGGLQGQYERVLQFVATTPDATVKQWGAFWEREDPALWASVGPSIVQVASDYAIVTALTGGAATQWRHINQRVDATVKQWGAFWEREDPALWASVGPSIVQVASDYAIVTALTGGAATQWRHINQRVVDWTRDYYATGNEYGSIPNLNETSRRAVADAVTAWTRGELAHNLGLPSLALELQPTFGAARAEVIAITEYTRIGTQTKLVEGEADPDIEYYRWNAVGDERTCSICGPVHGQVIKKDATGFIHPTLGNIGFSPAHPNCRCDISFETALTKDVPFRDSYVYTGPLPERKATP